jgi:ABC-type amino acid transport substrate-binding protein
MLRTRLTTGLAALAAAAVLSACNGGDTNNLSKSQFASKANALCTKAQADRAQQLQQLPPNPSGPTDAQKLRRVACIDRELARRVDALVPPPDEQDRVDRVLDGWRRRAGVEEQYASAVGAMQDPSTLAGFTASLAQIDAATDPVAVQLGVTECTRGTP